MASNRKDLLNGLRLDIMAEMRLGAESAAKSLEALGQGDLSALEDLFGHVRSVKSNSSLIGLEPARKGASAMERALVDLRRQKKIPGPETLARLVAVLGKVRSCLEDGEQDMASEPTAAPESEIMPEPEPDMELEPAEDNPFAPKAEDLQPPHAVELGLEDRLEDISLEVDREFESHIETLVSLVSDLEETPGELGLIKQLAEGMSTARELSANLDNAQAEELAANLFQAVMPLTSGLAVFSPVCADGLVQGLDMLIRMAHGHIYNDLELAAMSKRVRDSVMGVACGEDTQEHVAVEDRMLEDFYVESGKRLDELNTIMPALVHDPDQEIDQEVFADAIHHLQGLKSAALFAGAESMAQVCQGMEEVFTGLVSSRIAPGTDVFEAIKDVSLFLVKARAGIHESGNPEVDADQVLDELARWRDVGEGHHEPSPASDHAGSRAGDSPSMPGVQLAPLHIESELAELSELASHIRSMAASGDGRLFETGKGLDMALASLVRKVCAHGAQAGPGITDMTQAAFPDCLVALDANSSAAGGRMAAVYKDCLAPVLEAVAAVSGPVESVDISAFESGAWFDLVLAMSGPDDTEFDDRAGSEDMARLVQGISGMGGWIETKKQDEKFLARIALPVVPGVEEMFLAVSGDNLFAFNARSVKAGASVGTGDEQLGPEFSADGEFMDAPPAVRLETILDMPEPKSGTGQVLLLAGGQSVLALEVDEILGKRRLVCRGLPLEFKWLRGACLDADGPGLVVDAAGILNLCPGQAVEDSGAEQPKPEVEEESVVEDSMEDKSGPDELGPEEMEQSGPGLAVFVLDGRRYGVEACFLDSVHKGLRVQPLPDNDQGYMGLAGAGREIWPLADLGAGSGLEKADRMYVLARSATRRVAFETDGFEGVLSEDAPGTAQDILVINSLP